MFHCKRDFIEKAQHLRRWISLRMLTQGRLVPRQPWAIKRTTPTALHHKGIFIAKYIHGNINIISTALRCYNIHNGTYIHGDIGIKSTALHRCNIQNGKYIHWNMGTFWRLFIRMLASIVLWNARFNAVGVTVFLINSLYFLAQHNIIHVMDWTFQRRRCCAFDSPGLPNDSAGYPGLTYVVYGTTP